MTSHLAAVLQDVIDKHSEAAIRARRPLVAHTHYTAAAHKDHARAIDLIEASDATAVERFWRKHLSSWVNRFTHEYKDGAALVLPYSSATAFDNERGSG